MFTQYRKTKITLLCLFSFTLSCVALVFWLMSLLPSQLDQHALQNTLPSEIAYLNQWKPISRGKILAVVTSTPSLGKSGKSTGYEHTELARAYYVFEANGFTVDIASPKGGKPPAVYDNDDMAEFDYAFLNDPVALEKINNTLSMEQIKPNDYVGVYFVGGKGAMYDFPNNIHIQRLIQQHYRDNKVIAAVCHGPAALVNITLADGSPLLAQKSVTSFTNEEELFLIPNATEIFPFLLETKLIQDGADFKVGTRYLEHVVRDGQLITGQNPWSVWKLAETMVEQLGYQPTPRQLSAEENTVAILSTYHSKGKIAAQTQLKQMQQHDPLAVDRLLLAMHSVVALMEFELTKVIDLIALLVTADND